MIVRVLLALALLKTVLTSQCEPSATTAKGPLSPKDTICKGDLIFEDNFDQLDHNTWTHLINDGNGVKDFQSYVDSRNNSYAEEGILYIKATPRFPLDQADRGDLKPVVSARMSTSKSFGFKYGKMEIRARLPAGDWLWPALWLVPHGPSAYGPWPRSGEIDLMESRGNRNLTIKVEGKTEHDGAEKFSSSLHFGNKDETSKWRTAHAEVLSEPGHGWNEDFHKYQMEWSPNGFNFSVDDKLYKEIKVEKGFFVRGGFKADEWNPWVNGTLMAPFDQEFHVIVNMAVGGKTFFSNGENLGGKPWNDSSPKLMDEFWENRAQWLKTWNLDKDNGKEASLQVDYVRIWAI